VFVDDLKAADDNYADGQALAALLSKMTKPDSERGRLARTGAIRAL
jgi:hypothetical protein